MYSVLFQPLGLFVLLVLFVLFLKEKSITGVLKQFINVWRKKFQMPSFYSSCSAVRIILLMYCFIFSIIKTEGTVVLNSVSERLANQP